MDTSDFCDEVLKLFGRKRCLWHSTPPDGDCAIHAALADPAILKDHGYTPASMRTNIYEEIINNACLTEYVQGSINAGYLTKLAQVHNPEHPFLANPSVQLAADLFLEPRKVWFNDDALLAMSSVLDRHIICVGSQAGSTSIYRASKGGKVSYNTYRLQQLRGRELEDDIRQMARNAIILEHDGHSHFIKTERI